ncbi:hypothetical protein JW964_22415 [candidate division KSB1 bacterium]|nr:hypothetical protein [candidate division KSB1 bacterium]
MKDLLVLVADKDAELLIKELLWRIPHLENLAEFSSEIIRHPQRDEGIANRASDYVQSFVNDFRFLIVLSDYNGSGKKYIPRVQLETEFENQFNQNGWSDRNACIFFEPELEAWFWVKHNFLHRLLDWQDEQNIYEWLEQEGFQFNDNSQKPLRPKEAFEAVLKKQKIPHSSAIYARFARITDYRQCVDPTFLKFLSTLKKWFSNA